MGIQINWLGPRDSHAMSEFSWEIISWEIIPFRHHFGV